MNTSVSEAWKKFKAISQAPQLKYPALWRDNNVLVANCEKAEAFDEFYGKRSNQESNRESDDEERVISTNISMAVQQEDPL